MVRDVWAVDHVHVAQVGALLPCVFERSVGHVHAVWKHKCTVPHQCHFHGSAAQDKLSAVVSKTIPVANVLMRTLLKRLLLSYFQS